MDADLEWLETYNMDAIICPHCKHEFDDSWEVEDSGETECERCEQTFYLEIETVTKYTTKKDEY